LETIKHKIRIKDATNLPTKDHIPESVIDQSFTTRDHCAAVNKALVFQKRLNDLLLQQLWQRKPNTDKLKTKFYKSSKLYLCYESLQNNKVYTVRQGRSQGGHVGHCSKMTLLYEYFLKFLSKARYLGFW